MTTGDTITLASYVATLGNYAQDIAQENCQEIRKLYAKQAQELAAHVVAALALEGHKAKADRKDGVCLSR